MRKIFLILLFVPIISCLSKSSSVDNKLSTWWTPEERQFIISELNRTTEELQDELKEISDEQWNFREDSTRWSIAEIVEHLEMQNLLHYREISVISKSPQYLKFRSITKGQDPIFSNYSTDPLRSKAQWFLEPIGRYPSLKAGQAAFYKARGELTKLVEGTDIDFRKQFTFRTPVEGKDIQNIKIGEVRDLHQLLLTGIAHTDRHLNQIRKVKQHQSFPK